MYGHAKVKYIWGILDDPIFYSCLIFKISVLVVFPSIKLLLDLQGYHKWKSTPSLPSPFWENTRKYHWKKRSGIRKQSHYIVRLQTGLLYFPGSVKWTIASSSGSRTSKALGSTSKIFTWSDSPVAGPTDTVMEQECCPFEECCVEMTKTPKWPSKALKTITSNLPMTMSLNVILTLTRVYITCYVVMLYKISQHMRYLDAQCHLYHTISSTNP